MQHIFNRAVWNICITVKLTWHCKTCFMLMHLKGFDADVIDICIIVKLSCVWCVNLQIMFYVDAPEGFWCRCGWCFQNRTCRTASSLPAASSPAASGWCKLKRRVENPPRWGISTVSRRCSLWSPFCLQPRRCDSRAAGLRWPSWDRFHDNTIFW